MPSKKQTILDSVKRQWVTCTHLQQHDRVQQTSAAEVINKATRIQQKTGVSAFIVDHRADRAHSPDRLTWAALHAAANADQRRSYFTDEDRDLWRAVTRATPDVRESAEQGAKLGWRNWLKQPSAKQRQDWEYVQNVAEMLTAGGAERISRAAPHLEEDASNGTARVGEFIAEQGWVEVSQIGALNPSTSPRDAYTQEFFKDHDKAQAKHQKALKEAHQQAIEHSIVEHSRKISVDQLDKYGDKLKIKQLRDEGYVTIFDIREAQRRGLLRIPGIGITTTRNIQAAVSTWIKEQRKATVVKLDPSADDPAGQEMWKHAMVLFRLRRVKNLLQQHLHVSASPLFHEYADCMVTGGQFTVVSTDKNDQTVLDLLTLMGEISESAAQLAASSSAAIYREHAAEINSIFESVVGQQNIAVTSLDDDTISDTRSISLNLSGFRGTLRPYQRFGAQYAVRQKKLMLGDDMGLGKTYQAMAVLQHLSNSGMTKAIVACPAALVENWRREIAKTCTLTTHVVHGPGKHEAIAAWQRDGGVALTTYDTAKGLDSLCTEPLDALVADEAHLVKNPESKRTKWITKCASKSKYVLYLSGTPMENHAAEFAWIIKQLDYELGQQLQSKRLEPLAFRKLAVPIYLRRNSSEVLQEVPETVVNTEVLTFTTEERRTYYDLFPDCHISHARQATFMAEPMQPQASTSTIGAHAKQGKPHSTKLARIGEIVREAQSADRKVVIFSKFLGPLAAIEEALGEVVVGTIRGSVRPGDRQELIDKLEEAPAGSLLLSQIDAGGSGLNMQCASVVILCEPQFKPSAEDQAFSRLRRMGQPDTVLAYRLVIADTIDQSLNELVIRKAAEFDAFVRHSDAAEILPGAKDAGSPDHELDTETDENIAELLNVEKARAEEYRRGQAPDAA